MDLRVVTRLNRISNGGRSLSLCRRGRDSDVFLQRTSSRSRVKVPFVPRADVDKSSLAGGA